MSEESNKESNEQFVVQLVLPDDRDCATVAAMEEILAKNEIEVTSVTTSRYFNTLFAKVDKRQITNLVKFINSKNRRIRNRRTPFSIKMIGEYNKNSTMKFYPLYKTEHEEVIGISLGYAKTDIYITQEKNGNYTISNIKPEKQLKLSEKRNNIRKGNKLIQNSYGNILVEDDFNGELKNISFGNAQLINDDDDYDDDYDENKYPRKDVMSLYASVEQQKIKLVEFLVEDQNAS